MGIFLMNNVGCGGEADKNRLRKKWQTQSGQAQRGGARRSLWRFGAGWCEL